MGGQKGNLKREGGEKKGSGVGGRGKPALAHTGVPVSLCSRSSSLALTKNRRAINLIHYCILLNMFSGISSSLIHRFVLNLAHILHIMVYFISYHNLPAIYIIYPSHIHKTKKAKALFYTFLAKIDVYIKI